MMSPVKKRSEKLGRPLTFCVTTFGCQMNERDSEILFGFLTQMGYEKTEGYIWYVTLGEVVEVKPR